METDFSFKSAYENSYKAVYFNPSIIVCATDNIAIGVNRYLMEKQIKVPETISIAGFGGYDIATAIYPSLTTVSFDYEFLGFEAADRMVSFIEEKSFKELRDVPIQLVKRDSVRKL